MVEYTIDDIRGPTVAREMTQLKSFVLEKFNGAIADAEAAAAAAAQAVLDSLDARVGALEGDITTVQGAILTLDGAVVKLAGTQTITGTKNVPLEATGTASNQIASSQKVKNELDNYAPMVRTTGAQTIAGEKTLSTWLTIAGGHNRTVTRLINNRFNVHTGSQDENVLSLYDENLKPIMILRVRQEAGGSHRLLLDLRNSADDDTMTTIILGSSA